MEEAFKNAITHNFSKKIPFIVYAHPDSLELTGLFQNEGSSYEFKPGDKGFIFAHFSPKNSPLFIPLIHSKLITAKIEKSDREDTGSDLPMVSDQKDAHIALVRKGIDKIISSNLEKVVLSRKQDISLRRFDLHELLRTLFTSHLTAFRYVWFHPDCGLWIGATPETLLSVSDRNYKTMSLAGTRPANSEKEWTSKEYHEQQLVTDAITKQLEPFSESIHISESRTVQAGSIEHLRSDFEGKLKNGCDWSQLVNTLHPTPAVCGSPMEEAMNFIRNNEYYDRQFYTGYLGPTDITKHRTDLFVNLRCMRIDNLTASIYTGGGITKDSVPLAEWEETSKKQQTMLKLLKQFL